MHQETTMCKKPAISWEEVSHKLTKSISVKKRKENIHRGLPQLSTSSIGAKIDTFFYPNLPGLGMWHYWYIKVDWRLATITYNNINHIH